MALVPKLYAFMLASAASDGSLQACKFAALGGRGGYRLIVNDCIGLPPGAISVFGGVVSTMVLCISLLVRYLWL